MEKKSTARLIFGGDTADTRGQETAAKVNERADEHNMGQDNHIYFFDFFPSSGSVCLR